MNSFGRIDSVIEKLVKEGKTQFVIYPFGEHGVKVKEILNWRYGIQEVMIVDNHLAAVNSNILSVKDVKNSDSYTWLLTSDNKKVRKEIYDSIKVMVQENQIVDIFKPSSPYSADYKLLSQIGTLEDTRKPSGEFTGLVRKKKNEKKRLTVAEIGVGYGTTSVEVCKCLDEDDTYVCFDFDDVVEALIEDLSKVLGISCRLIAKGNSHKEYDSYSWELSNALFDMRNKNLDGLYDVVYLDGFHSFFHDGAACCLAKELIKPDGYLIFDDMKWSLAKSRTMNPEVFPKVNDWFTKEQISDCQIQRVVNAFMIHDDRFEQVYFGGNINPERAVFRKVRK